MSVRLRKPERESHCRYYVGLPFATTLSATERDDVEAALREATVSEPGPSRGTRTLDPKAVDVSDGYALVEFEHAPNDPHRAGHLAGQFYQALGQWARRNGYVVDDLRRGREWGTLPASVLDVEADRERVADRLAARRAGDPPTSDPPVTYYALAMPTDPITAEEREYVQRAARASGVELTDAGALVAFDPAHPRWEFSEFVAVQNRLGRLAPFETELASRYGWDHELGTLGWVDDATREAVRQRADQATPDPTNSDGEVGAES